MPNGVLSCTLALRRTAVSNYLLAYAPDEELLLVVSVLDGRRSPRVLAAILRGRK